MKGASGIILETTRDGRTRILNQKENRRSVVKPSKIKARQMLFIGQVSETFKDRVCDLIFASGNPRKERVLLTGCNYDRDVGGHIYHRNLENRRAPDSWVKSDTLWAVEGVSKTDEILFKIEHDI